MSKPKVVAEANSSISEEIGTDTEITIRLASGDRYSFVDPDGVEYATIEIGLEGDPVMSLYLYGPRGALLGHFSLWNR
ncbi:MAG TPA: hypothetical protein VJ464_02070 [Blastocatellia bacterium]|nr:hypothetical protein [Blastocatellia bacterium]